MDVHIVSRKRVKFPKDTNLNVENNNNESEYKGHQFNNYRFYILIFIICGLLYGFYSFMIGNSERVNIHTNVAINHGQDKYLNFPLHHKGKTLPNIAHLNDVVHHKANVIGQFDQPQLLNQQINNRIHDNKENNNNKNDNNNNINKNINDINIINKFINLNDIEKKAINIKDNIHIVISSGCSLQQHWQVEILFYSWSKLNHHGNITRIISGCKSEKDRSIQEKTSIKDIEKLNRISWYYTKDYSPEKKDEGGRDWYYMNKPYSFHLWLMDYHKLHNDINPVIVLLDPDMIITKEFDNHLDTSEYYVIDGKPSAARYGLGGRWGKWDICSSSDCSLSESELEKYYSAGPPYIATKNDWLKIAPSWIKYAPIVFESYDPLPSILGEMYAYCVASAEYNLRHTISNHYMVSNPDMLRDEGWSFLSNNLLSDPNVYIIHYCQGYWIGQSYEKSSPRYGGFNFHKGHVPENILDDCSMSLLYPTPNSDLAIKKDQHNGLSIYMMHWIIKYINEGVLLYRYKYCNESFIPFYAYVLQNPDPYNHNYMHYRPGLGDYENLIQEELWIFNDQVKNQAWYYVNQSLVLYFNHTI